MAVKTDKTDRAKLHQWVQGNLSAYIDGELSASEKGLVEGHLAQCNQCADDLQTLRQTAALVRALPARPVPRSFTIPERATSLNQSPLAWLYPYFRASAAVAAILLVITFCVDVLQFSYTVGQVAQAPARAPAGLAALTPTLPAVAVADQAPASALETVDQAAATPAEAPAEETLVLEWSEKGASRAETNAETPTSAEEMPLSFQAEHADAIGEVAAGPAAPVARQPQAEGLGAAPLSVPAPATQPPPALAPMLKQAVSPPVLPEPTPQLPAEQAHEGLEVAAAPSGAAPPSPTASPSAVTRTVPAIEAAPGKATAPSPTVYEIHSERGAGAFWASVRVAWRVIQGALLLVVVVSVAGVLLLRRR